MSKEARAWAWQVAPVPQDVDRKKNGHATKNSASCRSVLVVLGDKADAQGRDAFPSVEYIAFRTDISERSVRTCLDRLEAAGIITESTSGKVTRVIRRADHRPKSYDLQLHLVREDIPDDLLLRLVEEDDALRTIFGLDDTDGVQLTSDTESRGATGTRIMTSVAPEPSLNRGTSSSKKKYPPRSRRQGAPSRWTRPERDVSAATVEDDPVDQLIRQAVQVESRRIEAARNSGRTDQAAETWIGRLLRCQGDGRNDVLQDWQSASRQPVHDEYDVANVF